MRLALPVFHPVAPGRVLLRTGFELDERTLGRLRELRVRSVWVSYPELSFLTRYSSPAIVRTQSVIAGRVRRLFDACRAGTHADLEYDAYENAVVGLVHELIDDPDAAILVGRIAQTSDAELEHAATVCYLSTLMGLKLAWYLEHQRSRIRPQRAREVAPLGVAGMLHDIGMTRLSEEARRRLRAAPDPEDPEYRAHAEAGYRMVRGKVPPTVAAAVLHHHQRFDGTGFPRRRTADGRSEPVAAEQIHIYARIIAAADEFHRRTLTPDGAEVPRVRALSGMLRDPDCAWFDPTVLRALLTVCPPYPPGELVMLSDGLVGVVIGWDVLDPCRPRVMRFDPEDPSAYAGEPIVDLSQTPGVFVAEADGVDVGRDNFYPETPNAFNLDSAAKALHNAAQDDRHRAGTDPYDRFRGRRAV
jgi:HD-GYP domain-containing protein (c-di-GMP phosphodiesterase class II)